MANRAFWARLVPYWPPAVVSTLLIALVLVFVRRSLADNNGHLIYPIDDAYSHMAIAKNVFRHGLWGFSSVSGFSSGGSSLLWPLLLAAAYAISGVHDWQPIVLNVIPTVVFFFCAAILIRRHTRSGWACLLILSAILYFTPMPTLAVIGMEHCWQILIFLGFLDVATRSLADDESPELTARARRILPALAFMMTLVRYEGLFLVGFVCLLLLYRRQWVTAILCGAAGGLPITVFGLYAVSMGWHFLPNSLLLKASVPPLQSLDSFIGFITKGYFAMLDNPHMFLLVIGLVGALLVQWRRHDTLWNRSTLLLTMVLAGTVMHLQFAGLGWFYRYEGYLLALGILAISLAVIDEVRAAMADAPTWFERSQRLGLLALAVLLFYAPMWARAARAWNELRIASHNIYEQQFQMAMFLRQFYRGQGVAINDIGAVDFFADVGLVDLWGLGTMEVTQAKLDHTYSQDLLRRLFAKHDVRVVIAYVGFSGQYGGYPAEWIPVGQWTIPDNLVCGSPTVYFFAPNVTMMPKLIDALQTFSPHLPPGIGQAGLYCGQALPHVQGTYDPEKDGGGTFYWTKQAAQFALYPSDERSDAADVDSTLTLSTRTLSKGVSVDVTFNGKVIGFHRYAPEEVGKWVELPFKVHWREGLNAVNVMARTGQPKMTPGDDRQLLFAIHEPKWTFDDAPDEQLPTAPPSPAQ